MYLLVALRHEKDTVRCLFYMFIDLKLKDIPGFL